LTPAHDYSPSHSIAPRFLLHFARVRGWLYFLGALASVLWFCTTLTIQPVLVGFLCFLGFGALGPQIKKFDLPNDGGMGSTLSSDLSLFDSMIMMWSEFLMRCGEMLFGALVQGLAEGILYLIGGGIFFIVKLCVSFFA
jgi:hypothetical protein